MTSGLHIIFTFRDLGFFVHLGKLFADFDEGGLYTRSGSPEFRSSMVASLIVAHATNPALYHAKVR